MSFIIFCHQLNPVCNAIKRLLWCITHYLCYQKLIWCILLYLLLFTGNIFYDISESIVLLIVGKWLGKTAYKAMILRYNKYWCYRYQKLTKAYILVHYKTTLYLLCSYVPVPVLSLEVLDPEHEPKNPKNPEAIFLEKFLVSKPGRGLVIFMILQQQVLMLPVLVPETN